MFLRYYPEGKFIQGILLFVQLLKINAITFIIVSESFLPVHTLTKFVWFKCFL